MVIPFVDLKTQYLHIKYEIDEAIKTVLDDTAFVGGRYLENFEGKFASFTRSKFVIGVGNGTDALTLALRSLEIEPGFEVIVPANSFIATAEAVTNACGKVIFCDIDPNTYLMDLKSAESRVTPRTKVIIPVHLYGQMMDMKMVRDFADRHGLFIVEDAAQAHGVYYNGVSVGELSEFACYSFYPGKNLGAYGDGGAVSTNNKSFATKVRMLANHGRISKFDHDIEGVNSRLDGLQAAILSVKLKYLEDWNKRRWDAAEYYHKCLMHLNIPLPRSNSFGRHVYHLYVTRVKNRDKVLRKLRDRGIAAGIHYPIALPFLRAYVHLGYKPNDIPVAYSQMNELISLPIYPEITQDKIDYIATSMEAALENY